MTGGKIWTPVALFRWYRFEGGSKVGHAILHASPADRGSNWHYYMWAMYTGQSMFQRLYPEHRASQGLLSSARESFSHSVHHWPIDRQHLILCIGALKNESKLELI